MPHIFKTLHLLLRVDASGDEKDENLLNTLLPDDALGVDSVFKLIPKVMVELIGSS